MGKTMTHDTGTTDAERVEERYGNLVEALYGVGVLGADVVKTWPRVWRGNVWTGKDAISKKRFHKTSPRNKPGPAFR